MRAQMLMQACQLQCRHQAMATQQLLDLGQVLQRRLGLCRLGLAARGGQGRLQHGIGGAQGVLAVVATLLQPGRIALGRTDLILQYRKEFRSGSL